MKLMKIHMLPIFWCAVSIGSVTAQHINEVDSPMELFILPHGVDSENETVRHYWKQQPLIPTAKITLVPTVNVGPHFESLLSTFNINDLQFRISLSDASGQFLVDIVQPFYAAYDLNIGAMGKFQLTCSLFIEDHILSFKESNFTIRAAQMTSLFGVLDDSKLAGVPPVSIPKDLINQYTMNGQAMIHMSYFDDLSDQTSKTYPIYTFEEIERFILKASQREVYYYGNTDTFLYASIDSYPITGKKVLIIGSNVPWYESICISRGAQICVTLEYNELRYQHPKLTTFQVSDWENKRNSENKQCDWIHNPYFCKFDVIWSISSFEHDGLGRYGDPLNPQGDIIAMNKLLDYIEPTHGLIYLSIPIGDDAIYWNEQRVYGSIRLPKLLEHYDVVNSYGIPLGTVISPDALSIRAAYQKHQRLAPLETFQPVLVLSPTPIQ